MTIPPPRIRVVLLGLTMLVAAQVFLAIGAYRSAVVDDEDGFRLPLPARVAAMVHSIEAAAPELSETLLAAFRSEGVAVTILARTELDIPDEPRAELSQVERIVDTYVNELGGREIRAWLAPPEGESLSAARFERLRLWSPNPMRLAVSLNSGDWLLVESRAHHARSVLGTPAGFWSGLLGVFVAALALLTLWRGLAPLEKLAESLDAFAARPVPQPMKPRGPKETRRIITAVNEMQADLADFVTERQIMFGALSHDLRTYLTRLKLRLDRIPDDGTRERALHDVDSMCTIVEDALLLARLDAESTAKTESLSVSSLLQNVFESSQIQDNRLEISNRAMDAIVDAHPVSLHRAVLNLMDNAEKYAGGFDIEVYVDDRSVVFDVLDRGPGIAKRDRDRMLRPFERGDDARSVEKPGAGLGLTIAARALERAGGSLELSSRDGGGLIARARIPLSGH